MGRTNVTDCYTGSGTERVMRPVDRNICRGMPRRLEQRLLGLVQFRTHFDMFIKRQSERMAIVAVSFGIV